MEDTAAIIPPKAMVSRAIQKVRLLYSPVWTFPLALPPLPFWLLPG